MKKNKSYFMTVLNFDFYLKRKDCSVYCLVRSAVDFDAKLLFDIENEILIASTMPPIQEKLVLTLVKKNFALLKQEAKDRGLYA